MLGPWYLGALYACAITFARSFTLLGIHVCGMLPCSQFTVFSSSPPSPFSASCYFTKLLALDFSVMGTWAGVGFLADGAHGWVAGMSGFGVFYLPGCGVGGSSPLGTQPPCATQALTLLNLYFLYRWNPI